PYGFWLHVAAGLTIGGSLLYFWHRSDANWALVAVAAIVYVAFAVGLGRSSWAVLGALGLFLAAGHFASEWSGGAFELFDGEATTDWAPLVVFASSASSSSRSVCSSSAAAPPLRNRSGVGGVLRLES